MLLDNGRINLVDETRVVQCTYGAAVVLLAKGPSLSFLGMRVYNGSHRHFRSRQLGTEVLGFAGSQFN